MKIDSVTGLVKEKKISNPQPKREVLLTFMTLTKLGILLKRQCKAHFFGLPFTGYKMPCLLFTEEYKCKNKERFFMIAF